MKILFIAIFLSSTLTFGQNVPSYVPTNGLLGWWPFNGNANDESGNGNDGTVNGATLTSDRNGNANSAYNFNSNYIEVSSISELNGANDFTYSAWVELDNSASGQNYLICKGWDYKTASCNLRVTPTGVYMVVNSYNTFGAGVTVDNMLSKWHHFVVSRNGSVISFFVDGKLDSTFTYGGAIGSNTENIYFGVHKWASQSPGYYPYWLKGDLDDIAIWNRSLTQQEITDLYNASTCQTPTATITPQGNTSFCQGNSVVLEATSGSNYTYQWYKNGNAINGETNQTYTATTSGNYTVKVIDGACDASSSATTVTVNSNPTVSFTLSNMISNDNGNVTLNGSPSGGTYTGNGITGNTLDPSSVTLGKQTIVYNYTDNNGCSGSKTATTVIYDTTGTVCSTYDTTFVTIDVYDTTFVTQTIYDTITIENYISVTDTLIIDISLAGLSTPNNINNMKVYPNPSNDIVNIDNGDYTLMNGYSIKIINALGKEKFSNDINIPAFQIPVSQLGAAGVYYINIYDNQSKLVVSKMLVLE